MTTTKTTALQLADSSALDMLLDPSKFEHMQRVAGLFAGSALVPEHLKLPDVFIGLQIALRTGQDPLTVLQSMYVVSGKPGWSATYLIARANQSGAFRDPLDWEVSGAAWKGSEPGDMVVRCYATSASGKQVSASASMQMAKAEGWLRNPKYKSMPEQMLRYRAATFLVRLYCPEVMLGMSDQYELADIEASEQPPREVVHVVEAATVEAAKPTKGMAALAAALPPEPTVVFSSASIFAPAMPEAAQESLLGDEDDADKDQLLSFIADAEEELQQVGHAGALRTVREETGRLKGVDKRCGLATLKTYLDALSSAIDRVTQAV